MTQQINLVDATLLPPRPPLDGRAAAGIFGVALLVVAGHFGFESMRLQSALVASGTGTDAAVGAPADAASAPAAALAAQRQRLQRGEALRDALTQGRSLPDNSARLLQQVMAALPDTLWLTEIDLSGGKTIRIAGGALDASALAGFSGRLAQIDALKGTPIQVLQLEPQAMVESASAEDEGDAPATRRRVSVPYTFALASTEGAQ